MKIIKKLKFELIIFSVVFSIRGVLYFFGKDFDLFWPLAFVISFVSVSMFKLKVFDYFQNSNASIRKRINTMSGTGDQISEACKQIDAATSDQSSGLFQVSSSSEEIHAMVKRTGSSISEAKESVQQINMTINQSNKSAQQLDESFKNIIAENDNITNLLNSVVSNLAELTELFNNVADKTGVINDIVFQTKLLSFNASVEAARAGEHGKGFSVVAEEIGNLANMSGESANSIQQTLESTRAKVELIIKNVERESQVVLESFNTRVGQGKNIINNFNQNFKEVSHKSENILNKFEDIFIATNEQIKGISELKDAINLVNETVQRNNLVVSQTTDLANLLNTDMLQLQDHFVHSSSFDTESVQLDYLPWDKKYEIGIKAMDDEHIELLERINKLIASMNNNENILEAFDYMASYAISHFKDEEAFMEKMNYPSLESHKKVHANLIASVQNYRSQIEKGELNKAKLASFLKNWLFTHIIGVDLKYADHAHENQNSKFAA